MPAKKKGGKKKKKAADTADDDDWEAALNEVAQEAPKEEPKEEPTEVVKEEDGADAEGAGADVDDAAAAFLASMGAGGEETGKKKKKKKKKASEKKPAEKKETAAGKRIRELREQQEALKAQQDAEEAEARRQFEEKEEARQADLKKIQDEKDRIKQKQRDKIAKQKADGTYKTKKEKERDAKAERARAAMVKAGMVPTGAGGDKPKKKPMYNNKKKQQKKKKEEEEEEEVVVEKEPEVKEEPAKEEAEEESSGDDWDNDDFEVTIPVVVDKADEPEDELEIEAVKETERLRKVGLEAARKKKEEEARIAKIREEFDDSDGEMTKEELETEQRKEEARERREKREAEAESERSRSKLRSPICCIMGHVDTGKTKLLDKIRNTNVQDGEAGGITQQIGATFFPVHNIKKQTAKLNETFNLEYNLPGLLIIDTPGHESFSNLRSRGSNLCDIAILVIDIMHGLEPQTVESLEMLRAKKAPFVVALNKVDRLYDWKIHKDSDIRASLAKQPEHVIAEFHDRTKGIITQLMERGLNAALYYDNIKSEDLKTRISIIPTSAHTGEGIPDMLLLLVQLTQQMMAESLMFSKTLQCTILEVKVIEGLGTTIDCILVNGVLNRGDTIVVCTVNGPVVTQVRELLTPQPMREMRIKGDFIHHPTIEAAMGVKILGTDLENAIAGTSIWQVNADDDVDEIKEAAMTDIANVMDSIPKGSVGVHVQASTLGALEALLEFLNPGPGRQGCDPPIPVSGCSIGPVFKKDVLKASLQLTHNPDFACILAFDVPVKAEAAQMAEDLKVEVFTADIIYHLFDQFTAHMDRLKAKKREEMKTVAMFPSVCRILPNCIFNKKDPIVLGVHVEQGILKVGTVLCVPGKDGACLVIGSVTGLESNHKPVDLIKKGNDVAVSIQAHDTSTMYGRQFSHEDVLYSKLTRESINMLKEHFRKDLQKDDWKLVIKLKKVFGII